MASTRSATHEFMDALEDFFLSPEFTSAIGEFMQDKGSELEFIPLEETQPMKNHEIFMNYQALVEKHLTEFLAARGISQEAVMEACSKAQQSGDSEWCTCLDYLLASTEYESFMQLAYDHMSLATWEPEDGALDDCELPPAEDEEEEGVAVDVQEPAATAAH